MNSSSNSDVSISDGSPSKRKSSSRSTSRKVMHEVEKTNRSEKVKFVLDDEDDKKSMVNSKEAVTGSIIQHELHFFEFETKMRKVMYDIIEPNTKRVNSQSGQVFELDKQLKKANLGKWLTFNFARNSRTASVFIQRV
jgi:hypothetical protein